MSEFVVFVSPSGLLLCGKGKCGCYSEFDKCPSLGSDGQCLKAVVEKERGSKEADKDALIDILKAELAAARELRSVSDHCTRTHEQYCHICDNAECGDNTNPAIVALRSALTVEKEQNSKWRALSREITRFPSVVANIRSEDLDDVLRSVLREELTKREGERERLSAAIRWALGEGVSDFPPRPEGAGMYWWRTRLRELADLRPSDNESESAAEKVEKVLLDYCFPKFMRGPGQEWDFKDLAQKIIAALPVNKTGLLNRWLDDAIAKMQEKDARIATLVTRNEAVRRAVWELGAEMSGQDDWEQRADSWLKRFDDLLSATRSRMDDPVPYGLALELGFPKGLKHLHPGQRPSDESELSSLLARHYEGKLERMAHVIEEETGWYPEAAMKLARTILAAWLMKEG